MGAFIESVATARSRGGVFGRGGLRLSDDAARACLERAGRRAEELDLLLSAGVYKDKGMAEPALAAIIQEDIGANPGHPPRQGHHGTFSFDVLNGGSSALTALHLLDGFVRNGDVARLGMVVAGDADPSPPTRGFPYAAVGGAILVAHVPGDQGFQRFEFRTFPEHAALYESRLAFEPGAHGGHNVLSFREDPRFASRCVECASEAVTAFAGRTELAAEDIDLLVTSQHPAGFGAHLAHALGIADGRVATAPKELSGAHTAGPIAALEAAIEAGQLAFAERVLFVTVGAGLTVGMALYTRRNG